MDNLSQLTAFLANAVIVDLAHALQEDMPGVPAHSRFYKMSWSSPDKGDLTTHNQFIMHEHNGTHVDAPVHFFSAGEHRVCIDELPLKIFFGPCAVLNLEFLDKGEATAANHILDWENAHGRLNRGDIVLFNFGWAKLWKLMPDNLPFQKDFPGLGGDAARLLVDRGIGMAGCDTLSIEASTHKGHPAHKALLGNNIPIVENLANLAVLPPRCYFICQPLAIKGGSGSPIRPMAVIA
jgi:kynurenine formamidase